MNTNLILSLLNDLSRNNSLAWIKEHKRRYEDAKQEFEQLLQELINQISQFDTTVADLKPKEIIYRLNRDTRFSNDKSPYNPVFRAHISKGKKLPVPAGYFVHIKPEEILLGGGIYTAGLPKVTKLIRDYIAENPDHFLGIVNHPDFSSTYTVRGEKLKNIPKEYPQDHPASEYLKHKSWDIFYKVRDSEFLEYDGFINLAIEKFRLMKPFNDFLNAALVNFDIFPRQQNKPKSISKL